MKKMAVFKRSQKPKRYSVRSRKARAPKQSRYFREPRPGSIQSSGRILQGRITGLSRDDFGFPDRVKTKMIYADVITLTSTLGSVADYVFRMNSLFDPDFTGTGHQPQWFDQFSAVYTNYRVLGSKITCRFVPTNINDTEANDSGPFIVGVTTAITNTLSASSYATLLEDGNSNNSIIVDKQGANNCATVSNTYSPLRDLGVGPQDDTTMATTSNNPSAQFYAHVWAKDMDESSNTRVAVQVQIEYQVEFFRRIEGVLS